MFTATLLAALVAHVPVYQALPDRDVELTAEAPPAWTGRLVAKWRPLDGGAWRDVTFRKSGENTLLAVIPGDGVIYPGVEYFLTSEDAGDWAEASGSAAHPHPVLVALDEKSLPEVTLARRGGRRSQAKLSVEYVDHGRAKIEIAGRPTDSLDYYVRTEAEFGYRFLQFVQGLNVGIGVLEGRAPSEYVNRPPLSTPTAPDFRAGYRYGYAELHVGDATIGAYGKLLLGINHETFGAGVEGRIRLGFDPGTRFEVGAGTWSVLGSFAQFRLAWDTVPSVPMAAGIVVTDLPNAKDFAVRLVYDATIELSEFTRIGLRASYQARSTRFGGVGGGASIARDF